MIWIIGILCFIAGLSLGALLFKQLMSDAAKVEQLEDKLSELQSEYDHYKNNVHSHFSGTAQLVDNLTESYREVYRHLAAGAHALCPESISSQLSLSTQNHDILSDNSTDHYTNSHTLGPNSDDSAGPLFPPRDYADKSSPDQKGNLAEDYGLKKISDELEDTSKEPE